MRSKKEIMKEFEDNLSEGNKEDSIFQVLELLFDIRKLLIEVLNNY